MGSTVGFFKQDSMLKLEAPALDPSSDDGAPHSGKANWRRASALSAFFIDGGPKTSDCFRVGETGPDWTDFDFVVDDARGGHWVKIFDKPDRSRVPLTLRDDGSVFLLDTLILDPAERWSFFCDADDNREVWDDTVITECPTEAADTVDGRGGSDFEPGADARLSDGGLIVSGAMGTSGIRWETLTGFAPVTLGSSILVRLAKKRTGSISDMVVMSEACLLLESSRLLPGRGGVSSSLLNVRSGEYSWLLVVRSGEYSPLLSDRSGE